MKTALILGGGRGIGAATALELARRGFYVVVASRTRAELDRVVAQAGGGARAIEADIGDEASVRRLMGALDSLDVLVNSAGEAVLGNLEGTAPDAFERMVQVNLIGAYRVVYHALPLLKREGGQIIQVLSRAGRRPYENALAYGSAKCALTYLTRAMAAELGPLGVRINGISPGAVATALRRAAFPSERQDLLMQPEAVAAAIAEMTGPAFSGMNGAVIDFPW